MKTVAEKCIALDPNLSDCWWIKGIAETYLKETKLAAEDLKTAVLKTLGTPKKESLYMLIDACVKTEDYKCLVNNYNQLIALDPQNPQLYASLALANLKSKNYAEAKKQALKFLELMPEAKNEVEQFLKMLPVNYR